MVKEVVVLMMEENMVVTWQRLWGDGGGRDDHGGNEMTMVT
jgi:hypothetical protein